MTSFGQRFKKLRKQKGFTQEELVSQFNRIYNHTLGKSAISQYENNKRIPEIRVLVDFADYFGVSVDYLLGVSDAPEYSYFKEKGLTYPFPSQKQETDLEKLANQFIERINESGTLVLEGRKVAPEVLNIFIDIIQLGVDLVKRHNK